MAAKKRQLKPRPSVPPAAVGYADVKHHDLSMFVEWMRDRSNSSADLKKVLAKLEMLKANGIQWARPHVNHIDGTLWELKVRGDDTHRVYFRHEPPHARCVLYGTKNGQKADIERAKGIV